MTPPAARPYPALHALPDHPSLIDLVCHGATLLEGAGVAFGHGTDNAFDEAAWLVLWQLGMPLDTPLEDADPARPVTVTPIQRTQVLELLRRRIDTRQPAAYLTGEAWLQGVPFYVDERVIVPRSFIAELLVQGDIDPWLGEDTRRVLDLCTGNGSLAIIAAMVYPEIEVDAADLSPDALAVAHINVEKHELQGRIHLSQSDGLSSLAGPYDLILCNPPYVNATSMAALPAEYRAEPALALDGNAQGSSDGMDFIRTLLRDAGACLTAKGVLVLEIGNERTHFEAAFPTLSPIWLETSAGEDQVLLLTAQALT